MQAVADAWYRGSRWLWLLRPLSLLFALIVAARRLAYRRAWLQQRRLPVAVWVVGNITVGGAGKTPLTLALVEALSARGIRVGIVSRGYGGRSGDQPRRVRADSLAAEVGDEPLLLARRSGVPVMVHADRYRAGLALLAEEPQLQLLLLDDGLQHYQLARDCEIAVVDGQRRFGNGWLLPAGPLREPQRRLASVSARVCNGGTPQPGEWPMRLQPGPWRNLNGESAASLPPTARLWALAGIAHPARFFATLEALGMVVEQRLPLADHFALTDGWLQDLIPSGVTLVMTEKDAVKLSPACGRDVWYLQVTAQLPPELVEQLLLRHPLAGDPHAD
ncbi:MAG: tetraacyldisaccharide 4'-kinase [Corallincola sp.]|nr:tetraacyldisaccharide 4'-kinase [Corallincola sp.]